MQLSRKIIGGKLFSDSLARMSFILLLMFSIPVGFHHQLTEPGIDPTWKFIQVVLTFMVVIPTLMTAFSIFATFETTGRRKGYKSLFGWFKQLAMERRSLPSAIHRHGRIHSRRRRRYRQCIPPNEHAHP